MAASGWLAATLGFSKEDVKRQVEGEAKRFAYGGYIAPPGRKAGSYVGIPIVESEYIPNHEVYAGVSYETTTFNIKADDTHLSPEVMEDARKALIALNDEMEREAFLGPVKHRPDHYADDDSFGLF